MGNVVLHNNMLEGDLVDESIRVFVVGMIIVGIYIFPWGGHDIVVLVGEVVEQDGCGEGESFLMYVLRFSMEDVAVFVNNFVASFKCMCVDNFAGFHEYMFCEGGQYGLSIGNIHGAKRKGGKGMFGREKRV